MSHATVLIPAYNEAGRIGPVVQDLSDAYPVCVVDDGSTDETAAEARAAGADVIKHPTNRGYIAALKRGFRAIDTPIIVTFDADGEHRPEDIPRVIAPIHEAGADLVLGERAQIPRPSEWLLSTLARLRVDVRDTGTGLRAMRKPLAEQLTLDTACTCGTLVLEADARGASVATVPIETADIEKPRGVAWRHGRQFLHLLHHLLVPHRAIATTSDDQRHQDS